MDTTNTTNSNSTSSSNKRNNQEDGAVSSSQKILAQAMTELKTPKKHSAESDNNNSKSQSQATTNASSLLLSQGKTMTTTARPEQPPRRRASAGATAHGGSTITTTMATSAAAAVGGAPEQLLGRKDTGTTAIPPGPTLDQRVSQSTNNVRAFVEGSRSTERRNNQESSKDNAKIIAVDDDHYHEEEEDDDEMRAMKEKLNRVWQFALEETGNKEYERRGSSKDENNGDGENPITPEQRFEAAYQTTFSLVATMLDSMIRDGLHAYRQAEQKAMELQVAQETIRVKDQELERSRQSDANHQSNVQNLLNAVHKNKRQVADDARDAVDKVQLRNEIAACTAQRDQAQVKLKESHRREKLLEEELQETKKKLLQVEDKKRSLEKERRATMSWAQSIDSNVSSDSFYKKKVAEQNTHIQGLNAVIVEKNNKIEEMRRRVERSMSNNRIANLRASQTTGHVSKKARKSY